MNRRWTGIALPLVLLAAVLLLAGCGSSAKKPQSHTRGYNTDENLAAFRASDLFEMAEGYYGTCKDSGFLFGLIDSDSEYYINTTSALPTTPLEPFVVVAVRESEDYGGEPVWSVCGGSAEAMDLSGVRTLVVCAISRRGANYTGTLSAGSSSTTGSFHGSTEDATILYLDVASGECVLTGKVRGKDLPDRASGVPHYTLDDAKLVDRVVKDLTLPYTLTDEGEITGGMLGDDFNGYLFPESVKRITKLELSGGVTRLTLPASVESIADGAIPRITGSREHNYGLYAPVVLKVEPGSYAETFARENGYAYQRAGDAQEYVWLAGCECAFFSASGDYPLRPDGDLAGFVTLQRRVGDDLDAAPKEYYGLVVEEGSPAADYARAHQYPYRYSSAEPDGAAERKPWESSSVDPEEKTVRFCLDGQEWVVRPDRVVLVPEGFTDSEAIHTWFEKDEHYAWVFASDAYRQRFGAADTEAWVGDYDVAEQAKVTDDGLSWRLVWSFREKKMLAVTIPEGYVQSGETLDRETLLGDLGYYDSSGWPIYIVRPGSWAAKAAPVSIEAGTTVLRMRRDNTNFNSFYVNDYVCGLVTQVVDAYFGYGAAEPVRKLLDHGIRALYTQSPIQSTVDVTYVVPFAMYDQPDRLILKHSWIHWHINNGKLLEGISVLRIEDQKMDDEAERAWILERTRQDAPFHLEVVEGTDAEAFAKENGIPYELWDPQTEDITGAPLEQ